MNPPALRPGTPALPAKAPEAARRRRLLRAAALGTAAALVGWTGAPQARANLSGPASQADTRRRALIIGNARYPQGRLRNAVNDARLIAAAARHLGFQVVLQEDAPRATMVQALGAFLDDDADDAVRLFYFAGHGGQFRGHQFLLPSDAQPGSEEAYAALGIDTQDITDRLARTACGVNLLIFDACRCAPGSPRRGLPQAAARPPAIAPIPVPRGTLVVYSTAPGAAALDGQTDAALPDGAHGPFALHLAHEMQRPDVPVELMLKRVRMAVMRATDNRQIPWDASSLAGEFCLAGSGAAPTHP